MENTQENAQIQVENKVENKAVPIKFDNLSKEILKKCNPIMRETLINMGVRMVANSSLYIQYFLESEEKQQAFLDSLSNINGSNNIDDMMKNAEIGTIEDSATKVLDKKQSTGLTQAVNAVNEIVWDDFN